MPRGNLNTEHPDEVREAIDAVIDAMAECHNVVAAANEKIVAKIAHAARVLGWPDQVVSDVVNQIQSIAECRSR
jgi:acyl carrier protein phosphodiesterase